MEGWFQRLQNTITEHGIPKENIYNFDETGFRIGVGRNIDIVTREPKKKIYIPLNTNREYITVVEGVNASGWAISPFIIIAAKTLMEGWFDAVGYDQNYGIAVSDSGYINESWASNGSSTFIVKLFAR